VKLNDNAKKVILRKLTELLEELADEGVLELRTISQSIGYGEEKGFDYILPPVISK
jgi:hypothetical protein